MKSQIGLAVLFVCAAFSGQALSATIELDQLHYHNNHEIRSVFFSRQWVQTFTVGKAGTLARIEMGVSRAESTTEDLLFSLWTTTPDGLRDTLLYSEAKLAADFDAPAWQAQLASFDLLAANIAVQQGDVLAITLDTLAPYTGTYDVQWGWFSNKRPGTLPITDYVGGEARRCYSDIVPDACDEPIIYDLNFASYVAVVPVPAAVWLFGSALFGLRLCRAKK